MGCPRDVSLCPVNCRFSGFLYTEQFYTSKTSKTSELFIYFPMLKKYQKLCCLSKWSVVQAVFVKNFCTLLSSECCKNPELNFRKLT